MALNHQGRIRFWKTVKQRRCILATLRFWHDLLQYKAQCPWQLFVRSLSHPKALDEQVVLKTKQKHPKFLHLVGPNLTLSKQFFPSVEKKTNECSSAHYFFCCWWLEVFFLWSEERKKRIECFSDIRSFVCWAGLEDQKKDVIFITFFSSKEIPATIKKEKKNLTSFFPPELKNLKKKKDSLGPIQKTKQKNAKSLAQLWQKEAF